MRTQFDIDRLRDDFRQYCIWDPCKPSPTLFRFIIYFIKMPEFRSVVYYRIGWASKLASWLFRPQACLFINCPNIASGLHIQHGFSTIISAKEIGANCHIHQQVTVGWSTGGNPIIGKNVRINAGAIVIGGIVIGDDVEIAAGSVVTKDVPSHTMVAGVPAKPIKCRSEMSESWKRIQE